MTAKFNARALANLRGTLESHVERGRIPGAIAVIARAGDVEMFECFGKQDPQSDAAMKDDAIFRLYSMTKPIVSLAALMLMEEGALQMNDPLSKFLPEFANRKVAIAEGGSVKLAPAKREATVHDLLRHTAGLTYAFLGSNPVQKMYEAAGIGDRTWTNRDFCRAVAELPLQDQPGSSFQYSHATDVLGGVVEAVSGQTLGRFLSERIFEPLRMTDTMFNVPNDKLHRMAEPFAKDPDSGAPVTMLDARTHAAFESGGGGLFGTARDYVRFLSMMRNRGSLDGVRLVSRKTIEWMTSDHLGDMPAYDDLLIPGYGFGLGLGVR